MANLSTMVPNLCVQDFPGNSVRLLTKAVVQYQGRQRAVVCKWDTGASHTNISKSVVEELGMVSQGKELALTPGGRELFSTYILDLILPNGVAVKDVHVAQTKIHKQNIDVLIGMDVISLGTLLVTGKGGQTRIIFITPREVGYNLFSSLATDI